MVRVMVNQPKLAALQGCLIGVAVGDSLGLPAEAYHAAALPSDSKPLFGNMA